MKENENNMKSKVRAALAQYEEDCDKYGEGYADSVLIQYLMDISDYPQKD